MTFGRRSAPLARLAALQDLASIEHRRTLERACEETDRRASEKATMADELRSAEARLDAIYKDDRLCPVRLRIASAIVEAGEDALAAGRNRLLDAQMAEEQAGAAWLAARHRTNWLAESARALRKTEMRRRDERAECEARSLRLALKGSSRSEGDGR